MNKKYETQAKLLAQASQEISHAELMVTQHYTELLDTQQQKDAAVEAHMLEKATLESRALQKECEHKEEVYQLQMHLTQLESQYTQSLCFPCVPSEPPSTTDKNLQDEVVQQLPGMVNT